MLIFHKVSHIRKYLDRHVLADQSVGFVPTMGALHKGHLSLIQKSKERTHVTVSSIFVNPTQFNDPKDFEKYPVTIQQDIQLLIKTGCDVLFLPSATEIYPNGTAHLPHYELGYLETVLEGKYRPGHFQGVCQVVHRLLEIVQPNQLFLGQKDFQQCMVIKKLIEQTGLSAQLQIVSTLRENDGLAMSSRNMRLTESERTTATAIYRSLLLMKEQLKPGLVLQLKENATEELTIKGFRVDYTELAKADTLELVDEWNGQDKLVALTAAYLNEVRLIDNMIIT